MSEHTFALSDVRAYTGIGLAPPEVFSGPTDGQAMPVTARKAVSSSREASVSKIWQAKEGRPSNDESRLRTQRFLCLMADGHTAEQAAREARIGPWRALRIVTETDFLDVVEAIRAGAGPVAVTLGGVEAEAA